MFNFRGFQSHIVVFLITLYVALWVVVSLVVEHFGVVLALVGIFGLRIEQANFAIIFIYVYYFILNHVYSVQFYQHACVTNVCVNSIY